MTAKTLRYLLMPAVLVSCTQRPPEIKYDEPQAAVQEPEPPKPVQVIQIPEPLPLPGQLKPVANTDHAIKSEPKDPLRRVQLANAAAKVDPKRDGYINAIQVYPYTDGALYQVYVAPVHVTDIMLQPGEVLKSVAAGDTVQWKIGDTESGEGASHTAHVLIKPTAADLPMNNIVIATNRRTYHLEAHPTPATYMAAVSWQYPQDGLLALNKQSADAERSAAATASDGVDLSALRFRYAMSGDNPPWRPVQAFDDKRKVYIQFPAGISQGEMPPLFVIGPEGNSQLVNYRVRGSTMIVDRLFAAAELRLGQDHQQVVRISRTDGTR